MSEVPFFDLGPLVRGESDEIHSAIDSVLQSGYFVGGPVTETFENEFAEFLGVKHCIGVANGLDALRLLLEAHGIGAGDEVIVPAFTYYATWLGVTQTGATPVPVDVLASSANLDPAGLEAAITPRTRAVLPVHLYGQPADMAGILEVAKRHDLLVFEDAAQSHGSVSNAGMTGAVADGAGFSFYPTKNLGALGDAGAVTTSDDAVAATVRSRRSYGQGSSKYDHVDTGWNSRLDPIQAAVLSVHLRKLGGWTTRRREIAATYKEALGARTSAVVGPVDIQGSVWHHFVLRAQNRAELQSALRAGGVHTDAHYPYAVTSLAPMQGLMAPAAVGVRFPVAEALAQQVVSLPMGPWMTQDQVDQVAGALAALPDGLLHLA